MIGDVADAAARNKIRFDRHELFYNKIIKLKFITRCVTYTPFTPVNYRMSSEILLIMNDKVMVFKSYTHRAHNPTTPRRLLSL